MTFRLSYPKPAAVLFAGLIFTCGCFGPPIIEDRSGFTEFSLQRSGCLCSDCIQHSAITRDSDGTYHATRTTLNGTQQSFTLTVEERAQLLDIFRTVEFVRFNPPSPACLLGVEQNRSCIKTIFQWDDFFVPDWSCSLGGDATIALPQSAEILEFIEGLSPH